MNKIEMTVEADMENFGKIIEVVDTQLESIDCPMKTQMQIDMAIDEIFTNIVSYGYKDEKGSVTVNLEIIKEPLQAIVTFIDKGIPYNPLEKEDPSISGTAEERQIGGLGIFMVKKSMDDMIYENIDGQNILTIKKYI